jgi:F-type H+-transporting ATPase subunit delta
MQDARAEVEHYADALLALGRATGEFARFQDDLEQACLLVRRDSRIREFLADPAVAGEGKRRALEQLLSGSIHPVILDFLLILLDQDRLRHFQLLVDVFHEKISNVRRRASGELICAAELSPEQVAAVEHEAGRILGKDVALRVRVDPGLLGGILLRVGDFVLDGSLDRQLEDARHALLA